MLESGGAYAAINIGIGVGIAADAVLATIARARSLSTPRQALQWAGAIGLTHWLFPMIGFLGGWYLASHGVARALVYGAGGAVLFVYVFHVLRERSVVESHDEEPRVSFWLAVWGVSVDALITGPGKAAATAHWSTTEVFLSFPFVGVVVFVIVLASTAPAMMLHRRIVSDRVPSWQGLARFLAVSTWVEVLVFTWFAILSVIEACAAMGLLTPSYTLVSAISVSICSVMAVRMGRRVWAAQSAAARVMLRR